MGVPRSGEVIRASFISTYEDIPFEKAFGSIVYCLKRMSLMKNFITLQDLVDLKKTIALAKSCKEGKTMLRLSAKILSQGSLRKYLNSLRSTSENSRKLEQLYVTPDHVLSAVKLALF